MASTAAVSAAKHSSPRSPRRAQHGQTLHKKERREALKLAEEIGVDAAAHRLRINEDTLYGWRSREKERRAAQIAALAERSATDLLTENAKLCAQLKQSQQVFREAPETASPHRRHGFICAHRDHGTVAAMCRVLHISEQMPKSVTITVSSA